MTKNEGYCECACRDCFNVAIGKAGEAMCHGCEHAGCEAGAERECQRMDAYDCDVEMMQAAWRDRDVADEEVES